MEDGCPTPRTVGVLRAGLARVSFGVSAPLTYSFL